MSVVIVARFLMLLSRLSAGYVRIFGIHTDDAEVMENRLAYTCI